MGAQIICVVIAGGKDVGTEQDATLNFFAEAFAAALRKDVDGVGRTGAAVRVANAVKACKIGRCFRRCDDVIGRNGEFNRRKRDFTNFATLRFVPRGGLFYRFVDNGIPAEKLFRQTDFELLRGSGKLREGRRKGTGM